MKFWFLAFPDITKPVGGVKQLHRAAELITSLGFDAYIVQEKSSFTPHWFKSSVNTISRIEFLALDLDPSVNYIVLPETFIGAIDVIHPRVSKIIFNQNCGYTFGLPNTNFPSPAEVIRLYHHDSIRQIWTVSKNDYFSLKCILNSRQDLLYHVVNGLEVDAFPQLKNKKRLISYMPRKHGDHAQIVTSLLKSSPNLTGWDFYMIKNLTHPQVLDVLNNSFLFLSFGYPEGFGLPVAEALCMATSVVGYDGLGGRELFDIAHKYNCVRRIDFGDFYSFLPHVQELVDASSNGVYFKQTYALSAMMRKEYSLDSMRNSLMSALSDLLD